MNRKQKDQLRFLLNARKRADRVLAERRAAERNKEDLKQRKEASQELMKQYTRELTALAEEGGMIALAEQAASRRGGTLTQEVAYYVDYGVSTNNLQHAIGLKDQGKLKASYLALRINWEEEGTPREAEMRLHVKGQITFHNIPMPLPGFVWRRYPSLLDKMLDWAMAHATEPAPPRTRRKP